MATEQQKPTFIDPYYETEDLCRLQSWVCRNDHDYILSIRPQKGSILIITNLLWKKFCDAARKKGIDTLRDKGTLEKFAIEFEITEPTTTPKKKASK